ncbi:MAG: NADH-quinone oxidoreductase subunit L [Acidimicrobiales bacterium]|jgi:NADH-quinone oxidoreductase subunit L
MQLVELVWLVPLLPLLGFITLMFFGRRLGEPVAGWVATAAMGGSFLASLLVFAGMLGLEGGESGERIVQVKLFDWVVAGDFSVDIGLLADPLSVTMILFITGVATLIHLYSIGYMHGDLNFSKFFVYLNLFAFSMLMLVLGDNLLLTFLGWEGVGACSYFLISFWFTDEANASAGKKAFVTNRVGDFGFMLATFLAFFAYGSIEYGEMFSGSIPASTATAIALLVFVGAAGKSAQFPLYLWLPDAMAGPTPVSALIHAATMVTSGVYLLARINPILAASYDWAPSLIAWVGLFTALFAASIAVAQDDIKKVLAYSTVSQLGFMVVAVGTGVYVAALFHMITHAFFKALMFLGSGSVIHGMNDDQNMKRYGGLAKLMPITAGTFIIGWLAIAGIPPFSGFWSKDEILVGIYANNDIFANKVLFVLLLIAALLTAFYMTRLVILTFFGPARWRDEVTGEAFIESDEELPLRHPHESPWTMTFPLVVLAGAALVAGALNLPFTKDLHFLEHWLEPSFYFNGKSNEFHGLPGGGTKLTLAVIATLCAIGGIVAAWKLYFDKRGGTGPDAPAIMAQGWGYDNAVSNFMGGPGSKGFDALADFDGKVVDGAVNGVGKLIQLDGNFLRRVQNGLVRSYAVLIALGAIGLMVYFLVVST